MCKRAAEPGLRMVSHTPYSRFPELMSVFMTQPCEWSLLPEEPVLGGLGSALTCFPQEEREQRGGDSHAGVPQETLNHGGRLPGPSSLRGHNTICPVGYSPVVGLSWGKVSHPAFVCPYCMMLKILGKVQIKSFRNNDAKVSYLNSPYFLVLVGCSSHLPLYALPAHEIPYT